MYQLLEKGGPSLLTGQGGTLANKFTGFKKRTIQICNESRGNFQAGMATLSIAVQI